MLHTAPLEFPVWVAKLSHSKARRQLATIFEDEEPQPHHVAVRYRARGPDHRQRLLRVLDSVESIREHLALEPDLLERAATAILPPNMFFASGPAS